MESELLQKNIFLLKFFKKVIAGSRCADEHSNQSKVWVLINYHLTRIAFFIIWIPIQGARILLAGQETLILAAEYTGIHFFLK